VSPLETRGKTSLEFWKGKEQGAACCALLQPPEIGRGRVGVGFACHVPYPCDCETDTMYRVPTSLSVPAIVGSPKNRVACQEGEDQILLMQSSGDD
jgi:hypothetical protein